MEIRKFKNSVFESHIWNLFSIIHILISGKQIMFKILSKIDKNPLKWNLELCVNDANGMANIMLHNNGPKCKQIRTRKYDIITTDNTDISLMYVTQIIMITRVKAVDISSIIVVVSCKQTDNYIQCQCLKWILKYKYKLPFQYVWK